MTPASRRDKFADTREQRWVEFLDPAIDQRLAAGEDEAGIVIEAIHR
jgi:hypothetical protein